MTTLTHPHRCFTLSRFLWNTESPDVPATNANAEKRFEKKFNEGFKLPMERPPKDAAEQQENLKRVADRFKEFYDPKEKYESAIRDFVDTIEPKDAPMVNKEDIVRNSVYRYNAVYTDTMRQLLTGAERDYGTLKDSRDAITEKTKSELATLRRQVEGARTAAKAGQDIEQGKVVATQGSTWDKIPILSKFSTLPGIRGVRGDREYFKSKDSFEKFFGEFVQGLTDQYTTKELQHSELGKEFSKQMSAQAKDWVKSLFESGKATPATMKEYQEKLAQTFERFASLDGRPGAISAQDLLLIRREGFQVMDTDFMRLISQGTEGHLAQLESLQLQGGKKGLLDKIPIVSQMAKLFGENPKMYENMCVTTANIIVREAVANGADEAFIEQVNQYQADHGKKAGLKDFDAAQKTFFKIVENEMKGTPANMMKTFESFDAAINAGRRAAFDNVQPPALKGQVYIERQKLLNHTNEAMNDPDKLVVEFVGAERTIRDEILANPYKRDALFRAIKTVKLYTVDGKTLDVKNARVQALKMMADEAAFLVGNLSKTKLFAKSDLAGALEQAEGDAQFKPNVDFKDRTKTPDTRYVSEAARAGLSGKGILGGALTVWLYTTAAFNAFQAYQSGEIMNPYLFAAIGGIYVKNRPQLLKIPFASPGEGEAIWTHTRLTDLSKKTSLQRMRDFVAGDKYSSAEWKAVNTLKENQAKVKELIQNASKRPGPSVITNADLQKIDLSEEVKMTLRPDGPGNLNRERYLFYAEFLGNQPNDPKQRRSFGQLEQDARHWAGFSG